MTDYNKYKAEGMERLQMYGKAIGIIVMIGLLFYKSIVAILLFLPFSVWLVKYQEKQRMKDRKWEFNQQFKQGLLAISSSLNAGYSVENAFGEAVKDLELVYEEKTDIMMEFRWMEQQISLNKTVEEVLADLAERTRIADVENFIEIFRTAKRTGGDIIKIIQQTGKNIGERIEIQREVETVIAEKKLESNIMAMVPLGMIGYMWLTSPGFLEPLYHNLFGTVLMTGILLAYLGAYWMMQKIMDLRL